MKNYPAFNEVFETLKEVRPNWMDEVEELEREADACYNGKEYSVNEHVEKLILAMLSCQRRWQSLVPHIDNGDIPKAFFNYDANILKATPGKDLYDSITAKNCGNRRISKQTACLSYDIAIIEKMYEDNVYDIKHGYYSVTHNDDGSPNFDGVIKVIRLLAEGKSADVPNAHRFKMEEMGVALVCEYIKGFGINVVKPDTHVCRILGRLGLNPTSAICKDLSVYNAIKVCNDIADEYCNELKKEGVTVPPAILVDTIIWQFGAEEKANICSKKNPKCNICLARNNCPYFNSHK